MSHGSNPIFTAGEPWRDGTESQLSGKATANMIIASIILQELDTYSVFITLTFPDKDSITFICLHSLIEILEVSKSFTAIQFNRSVWGDSHRTRTESRGPMRLRVRSRMTIAVFVTLTVIGLCDIPIRGSIYNLRIVSDSSPDYHDLDSMIHRITSEWETPEAKCWALSYWNHIARRQTSPMIVHGIECTDPIRPFSDCGYTMCCIVTGINCSIRDAMGYSVKFRDISNHTVSEIKYGGFSTKNELIVIKQDHNASKAS